MGVVFEAVGGWLLAGVYTPSPFGYSPCPGESADRTNTIDIVDSNVPSLRGTPAYWLLAIGDWLVLHPLPLWVLPLPGGECRPNEYNRHRRQHCPLFEGDERSGGGASYRVGGINQINLVIRSVCCNFNQCYALLEDRLRLGNIQINLIFRSPCTIFVTS